MKTTERLDSETLLVTEGEMKYIQFDGLLPYADRLTHCVSTRIGGVSTGECSTLNLGFNRKDTRENVVENYRRLCQGLDLECESMVFSNQVHDNKIRIVGTEDRGKGFSRQSDILGFDGLATGEKGLTLVTFYADCIPVLLYDKSGKGIAGVHSGWRSTCREIARKAAMLMKAELHANPEDLICVIGPGIGKCCFEVDGEVYREFAEKWPQDQYYHALGGGKWTIDLRSIIAVTLQSEGIPEENIHMSTVCTKCRRDLFFSHRGDHGKTGSLAAFLHMRE